MEHEKEGVAVVNMTGVHAGLLQYKKYADMTGNNVNHANDYLARAYAQTLLKTLEVSEYGIEEPPTTSESASDSVDEETSETSETQSSASDVATSVPSDPVASEENGCGSMVGGGLVALVAAEGVMVFHKKKKEE